jgi:hypothetical protein
MIHDEWFGVPANIEDWLGFVYMVTAPSGRKYVGKKLFWSSTRKKPLKGKTRNRIGKKESDWRKYYGSSEELKKEFVATQGIGWKREILHLGKGKCWLAFAELKVQLGLNVFIRDDFYNRMINVRLGVFPKDIPYDEIDLLVDELVFKYGRVSSTFN